jgi:hypothetical protein
VRGYLSLNVISLVYVNYIVKRLRACEPVSKVFVTHRKFVEEVNLEVASVFAAT